MRYERGSFIVVPSRERLRGMPVPAQALYMWLCAYANEEGECFPSRAKLAKDLDCSLPTVDRFTDYLVLKGLLKVEKRFTEKGENMANLYSLVIWEGGSKGDLPPGKLGLPPVVKDVDTELNPILTKSTYYPATRFEIVKDSGKPEKRSNAKYPHSKEVFSWFPRPQKSWESMKNVQEREYAEYLYERGETAVRKALAYCEAHADEEFCPKVSKPSDLEKKWLDISAYAKRSN